MCSKSDCDSVISWESRHAVLATIPVSSKLMWMDLFYAYLFWGIFFMTFPQFLDLQFSLLWNLITEPGKIAEQGMFPSCNFTPNQPHFSLRSAWRDDRFGVGKWHNHQKSSDLIWIPLRIFHTLEISADFFSSSFPVVPHSEIAWEWGNAACVSSIIWAALSFAFCLFLSTC